MSSRPFSSMLFVGLALLAQAAQAGQPAPGPAAHVQAACRTPPAGMVCVPGGPAVIGSRAPAVSERPRHTVELSTFYLDERKVSNAEYAACENSKACPRRRRLGPKARGLQADDLPATPVTWFMAQRYCAWAGKRQPTEAEWEKASPAGEGYEWVQDWASQCYRGCERACGRACFGRDPRGPCQAGPRCKGRWARVLKGGARNSSAVKLRPARRLAQKPDGTKHLPSFRCAATEPELAPWPPLALASPLPDLADPGPPDEAELRAFADVAQDEDVLRIPKCERKGKATVDCRDPLTYITTNEGAHEVWLPFIRNVGGGYAGLGSDQNYSLVAAARSRWVWLFDYDPNVVRLHQLVMAVIRLEPDPVAFVEAFSPERWLETRRQVQRSLTGPGKERRRILALLGWVRMKLYWHYRKLRTKKKCPDPADPQAFGWLCNPEHYRYVRLLVQQGRIMAIKGNMLTDVALPGVAQAARRLGVPIRVYYPSNAEENWPLTGQYAANVLAFPFDERSVTLRTIFAARWPRELTDGQWHYLVQGGLDFQASLRTRRRLRSRWFMQDAVPTSNPKLSAVHLSPAAGGAPAALADQGAKER